MEIIGSRINSGHKVLKKNQLSAYLTDKFSRNEFVRKSFVVLLLVAGHYENEHLTI